MPVARRDLGDGLFVRRRQIGSDLDQQRLSPAGKPQAFRAQGVEKPLQRLAALQIAQPRRVRRRHVDGDIVGQRIEAAQPGRIVGHGIGGGPC